jgi:hypothetical protein
MRMHPVGSAYIMAAGVEGPCLAFLDLAAAKGRVT